MRDGITQVIVSVTRTSATPIKAGATGNINNVQVCDTPAPCRIGTALLGVVKEQREQIADLTARLARLETAVAAMAA